MIHEFLCQTLDIKRSNLTDALESKAVISPAEGEGINSLKKTRDKVDNLMRMLRKKSAAEFERFLAALSETGQQSVADVVRQSLRAAGLTGQNPLQQHLYGESVYLLCI